VKLALPRYTASTDMTSPRRVEMSVMSSGGRMVQYGPVMVDRVDAWVALERDRLSVIRIGCR
jgi:hypothetical protein